MAVRLVSTTRQWVGTGNDPRPVPNTPMADGTIPAAADIQVGSTLTYLDTGAVWEWNGDNWLLANPSVPNSTLLLVAVRDLLEMNRTLSLELRAIRMGMQLQQDDGNPNPVDLMELALAAEADGEDGGAPDQSN